MSLKAPHAGSTRGSAPSPLCLLSCLCPQVTCPGHQLPHWDPASFLGRLPLLGHPVTVTFGLLSRYLPGESGLL